jgi:hypothetical protein
MNDTHNYYYPETIKMITNAVIGLWDNVVIYKFDRVGAKTKEVTVPVIFGPQTKMQRASNSVEANEYYPELPRININPQGLSFASDRLISPNTRRFFNDTEIHFEETNERNEIIREINGLFADFSPVPYDFQYEVNIICSTMSEMSQILENTLPYFGPKNTTIRVKEFDFLNIERDLAMELGGISVELTTEMTQDETRLVTANFDLTVFGYIYRPIVGTKIVNTVLSRIFKYDPAVGTRQETLGYVLADKDGTIIGGN